MNAVGDRQKGGPADTRFLSETATDPVEDIVPVTMSMALAFLGTAQTAAVINPRQKFQPNFRNWYSAALRDMRRKQSEIASQIEASLNAHAHQFGSDAALASARSGRGLDWPMIRHRLRNSLAKLRQKESFRLLAEIEGLNTIETAARMCDDILGQDAARSGPNSPGPAVAWQLAIDRSRGYKRQM